MDCTFVRLKISGGTIQLEQRQVGVDDQARLMKEDYKQNENEEYFKELQASRQFHIIFHFKSLVNKTHTNTA